MLLLLMHHIVFDGWSEGVLLMELGTLYAAYSKGSQSSLPALRLQYREFAVWQQQRMSDDRLREQLSYWQEQLRDFPSALALPTDFPRAAASTLRGACRSFTFDSTFTTTLTSFARGERVTLFMVLLAAFQAVLGRYSAQDDVLVGVPTAGRTHAEVEEMLGCFMNVLVLRGDLSGNPSFRALLRRVRECAVGAYAHQELPFEKLVEALRPSRDPNRWPLFQVMFNMHVLPRPETAGATALSIEPFAFDSGIIGGLDLSLRVDQVGSTLACSLAYASDLFLPDTIDRIASSFRTFLEAAIEAPESTIAELPLLGAEERRRLLVDWNCTATPSAIDQCIHQLFEAQAKRTPDAVAVEFEHAHLTYAELDRRANRLAHRLRALGVGPEVRVALCVERSLEMAIGILGVLKAGGAYVPIEPSYPNERIAFMIGDAGSPFVLTQSALVDKLPPLALPFIGIDDGADTTMPEEAAIPASGVTAANAAYVIYTSGSTGRPKGVVVCHRSVCNHLLWRHDYFRMAPHDRLLQTASFCFDDSVWEFFEPLAVGACVVIMRRHDAGRLADLIAERGITAVCLVPSLLRAFLDDDLGACTRLKRVSTGGETLPVELVERFFSRLDCELDNGYGPTEATIAATFWRCRRGEKRWRVPIGRPIANTSIYVLDDRFEPVPIGVAGELYIGGACLARGYLNAPELTAERFIADPFTSAIGARLYRTGDVARYLPDGNLEFLGRLDDQVKIRGFRVEPGEIEAALLQHAAVREAVVVARDHRLCGWELIAYVVVTDSAAASAPELRACVAKQLPDYMVPGQIVIVDRMPIGANGKIDRRSLPLPDRDGSTMREFIAPRSPLERTVAGIWSQALGVSRVGVYDNFFELGGHSLLAMQVISQLRKAVDVELSLRSFFESPTISAMAAAVSEISKRSAATISRQPRALRKPRFRR